MRVDGAGLCVWLAAGLLLPGDAAARAAEPRAGGAGEIARKAAAGDAAAAAGLEPLLDPLFARKDLWTLDPDGAAREAARLLGAEASGAAIRWFRLDQDSTPMRLLTVDFVGSADAAPATSSYTAYAVVERTRSGDPGVSWYHDVGRRVGEQGGLPWHPVGARSLPAAAGGPATILVEASTVGTGPAAGLIVLDRRGGDWQAARRISPPAGASLVGAGPLGAVFVADRVRPAGVLTGAPAGSSRSLILYDRGVDGFAAEPMMAPVEDVISAAEALIAALKRGDKEAAARMCVSPDVVEQMLYFTPDWTGGGRIVKAGRSSLEIVYEERERPSLRLELSFRYEGGALKLASAAGRAEGAKP